MIRVRVSQTIANEYRGRMPDDIPTAMMYAGVHELTTEQAAAVHADAAFNADANNGPEHMPQGTRRAYRALAEAIAAAKANAAAELQSDLADCADKEKIAYEQRS